MISIRVRRLLLASTAMALVVYDAPSGASQSASQQKPPQAAAPARDWSGDIPAHISHIEGSVTLEREKRLEPAELNVPLLAGDQIVTRRGRVEVLFADGSIVAIDDETEVEFLSDSLVKLDQGRLRIRIQRTTKELEYRVDTQAGTVWIDQPGEYRVQLAVARDGETEVDLAVYRGAAELVNDHGSTMVSAGAGSVATANTAPSKPFAVNSARRDDFDRWTDDARNARVSSAQSVEYLPEEVSVYAGAFDTYGSWEYYQPSGGYVWYPTVAATWRPYHQGRWSYSNYYGWFWVGVDYWSWPTHHYGYWGVHGSRWYWVPGSYWAPAYVSWYSAPGYVGWCPLGYGGVPVVAFHSPYYHAWTVIPAYTWNHNVWVTPHVVPYHSLSPSVVSTFAAVSKAPRPVGQVLATREAKPLRGPVVQTANARTAASVPQGGRFDRARVPARTADTTQKSVIRGGGTPPAPQRDHPAAGAATARNAAPSRTPASRNAAAAGNAPSRTVAPDRSATSPPARSGNGNTSGPAPRYARNPDVNRAAPVRSDVVERQPPPGIERQSTPRANAAPQGVRQPPPRLDARPDLPARNNFSNDRPSPPAGASAPKYSGPPASYAPPSRPSAPAPQQAAPPRNAAPPSAAPPRNAAPPTAAPPPPRAAAPPPAPRTSGGGSGGGGGGKGRGGDK